MQFDRGPASALPLDPPDDDAPDDPPDDPPEDPPDDEPLELEDDELDVESLEHATTSANAETSEPTKNDKEEEERILEAYPKPRDVG